MAAFGSQVVRSMEAFTRASKPQHMSGRAQRGLFAGKDKKFGNNISFSHRKTRRAWKVNHQWKRLYSETLDEMVGLNVTTHTLRCVDKAGGLDSYLLSLKNEWDLGVKGLKTRDRIVAAMEQGAATKQTGAQA